MKLALFLIIFISAILAITGRVVSGLGWGYFPSSAVGVAFYEHNDLLVLSHALVGLVAMCCLPYHNNRKTTAIIGIAFLSSLFIHLGSKSYHSEKEINVKIDSFLYRVSSLELPTVDFPQPYGPSPFKPLGGAISPNEKSQSLYYSPKKQYGYSLAVNLDENDRFFLAIHSKEIDKTDEAENSILIIEENRILEFYPDEPFESPKSIDLFQKFIKENLSEIQKDINSRPV